MGTYKKKNYVPMFLYETLINPKIFMQELCFFTISTTDGSAYYYDAIAYIISYFNFIINRSGGGGAHPRPHFPEDRVRIALNIA